MDEDNASSSGPNAHVVGVKSWIAYLGVFALAAVLFGAILPLTFTYANEIAAAIVMAVSVGIVGYRILELRSVQLYYDDVGVWVFSGVLPWKKGLAGVKWRDMDEATFEQGFWSWISRSYTIRIGHRFTKASEIRLTNIAGGKDAVGTLNAKQQAMIRAGDGD
ncbi:hypothetical protein [Massilia sp. TSP1-1-2]|uniref:hypothetical protein n=1 Tax=unclassified Massilia TaxID=2609279 RepID=UPI003CF3EC26